MKWNLRRSSVAYSPSVKLNTQAGIISITGPTASGKSSLAVEIASKIGGEIVNADSVQVYKELDIGSAKPTLEELKAVPHHLISYVEPDEAYSVGRFRKDCLSAIEEVSSRGQVPIVTGGSGLYLSSLYGGLFDSSWMSVDGEDILSQIRDRMSDEDYLNWSSLLLKILDPKSDSSIPLKDVFRRERALSLSLSLGAPSSRILSSLSIKVGAVGGLVIILDRNRENLYQRIDSRVHEMIDLGLVDEVGGLLNKYGSQLNSLKAIGYSQVVDYLSERKQGLSVDIEGLIKIIQRDTRRFAKRQLTWWRNQPKKLGWIDVLDSPEFNSLGGHNEVSAYLMSLIERYRSIRLDDACGNSNLVYVCRVSFP